jgi:hypothetical protein
MVSSASMGKSKAVSSHRSPRNKDPQSHAETRRVGDRVPQLPRTFSGNEDVLECSGLTELWMESSAPMGKIQSGVKPPQSKKQGSAISREDAKARRVGDRVPQLPKTFCGNEGVLECSGLTELWMGIERVDGENPKRCQATAVQERRIRNLTRRRGGWGIGFRRYPRRFVEMRVSWSAPA